MRVTDEKKRSFQFIQIIWTKNFNESHFYYSALDLSIESVINSRLLINKDKDTYKKYQ